MSSSSSSSSSAAVPYGHLLVTERFTFLASEPEPCVFLFPCCSAHSHRYHPFFPSIKLVTDMDMLVQQSNIERELQLDKNIIILAHREGIYEALIFCKVNNIDPLRVVAMAPPTMSPGALKLRIESPDIPAIDKQRYVRFSDAGVCMQDYTVTAIWPRAMEAACDAPDSVYSSMAVQRTFFLGGLYMHNEDTLDAYRLKYARDDIVKLLMGEHSHAYKWCRLSRFHPSPPMPCIEAAPAEDESISQIHKAGATTAVRVVGDQQYVPFTAHGLEQFRASGPYMQRYDDLLFALQSLYTWKQCDETFYDTVTSVYARTRELFDTTYQKRLNALRDTGKMAPSPPAWQDVDTDDEGFGYYITLLHARVYYYPILYPHPAARMHINACNGDMQKLRCYIVRLAAECNALALMALSLPFGAVVANNPSLYAVVLHEKISVVVNYTRPSNQSGFSLRRHTCTCELGELSERLYNEPAQAPIKDPDEDDDDDDQPGRRTTAAEMDEVNNNNKENIPPVSLFGHKCEAVTISYYGNTIETLLNIMNQDN